MIRRDPNKNNLKPKSFYSFIYRFLKRNSLSIRSASHFGQQLPEDSIDKTFTFLKERIHIRKTFDIAPDGIVNMDQTELEYNMPKIKTIHKNKCKNYLNFHPITRKNSYLSYTI